ncbi:MAG: hypothetical protein A2958_00045 [Candidatus Levybacteria bacterium RIFCSPLOWO2_01_FULL_38_13]|nr:MAG: hypothetical protein A2629_02130 [Candidatus Levybacteria bacterium RIFCSPHIGHO2_01_FULL_41_15]OGH34932.1 MAG: hypothetical protein A2958_00045 [Candidatus Levybacteria bacterium RIFCSPLOWO2_01_FULL_38_13]
MNINQIVILDIAFALLVVSVALWVMVISYSQLLKKMNSYQRQADDLKKQINYKESRIIDEAREKAREIIDEALEKAQRVISESQSTNSQAKKMLDDALEALIKHQISYFEKASQDFLNEYRRELGALKQRSVQIARNVSEDIGKHTLEEVQDFDSILQKETIAAQKIVEDKIEDQYSGAQKEVEEYKNEMMKKAEEEIYKILENVSKIALGKGLSLQEHEQLIIDALEKAKKAG